MTVKCAMKNANREFESHIWTEYNLIVSFQLKSMPRKLVMELNIGQVREYVT